MNTLFIQSISLDFSEIDENSYLKNIPVLKNFSQIKFTKPITIFSGENGSGKSTLLEAMAISAGFNPEGGTKNYNFSTYNSHSELYKALTLGRGIYREKFGYFFRAESFYNVSTAECEYSDISHPSMKYHEHSHGESFLIAAENYLKAKGLYFLDEPEAALSPQRQLTLLIDIYENAKNGAQFFIATHSPILLGIPAAEILNFSGEAILPCKYEETDSYKITEMFINHKEQFLKNLF